jgi:hypothetical protein
VIDGVPVVDGVVHAYNLSEANVASELGGMVREGFAMLHGLWNPPDAQMPAERYKVDQSAELLATTLFCESDVDLACFHTLRLDSLFSDGLCSRAKNVELQQRWPERFVAYVGLDPTLGVDVCLRELESQLDELPQALGVKLYPDQLNPYRTYRMDDAALCFPLYERAQERGVRVIAVHKALPNGPVPLDPYRIDDVEGAAMAFPGLNFEIVHAGMAFVSETAYALARFPNVYANLEVTAQYLWKAPRLFQELLAEFLFWSGPGKVIWGTGALFGHPQTMLERFWALEWDPEVQQRWNLPPLDRELKAQIVGRNFAAMCGIDLDARVAATAGDEWATARAARGGALDAPFSHWRAS